MKCWVIKEAAGKDEGQSELWSGAMQTLEKALREGSTHNLWLLKGPFVEDRMDAKVLGSKRMKKRVLAS